MNLKSKLNYIKKMRKLRDEILICENEGRLRWLINCFPDVMSYDYCSGGWRESRIIVRLNNGYEYREYSDGIINDNCLNKMGLKLYHLWRKDFLLQQKNR